MPEVLELPTVVLPATKNDTVEFPKDAEGHWTVLYFYPKDDTPGCTVQACGYRDLFSEFKENGIDVYGVSLDDLPSHYNFESKFSLNFPLLCDEKKELSKALGALNEKFVGGKKSVSLQRDSFLIDPKGRVVRVWRDVDPVTTVEETLNAAKELMK